MTLNENNAANKNNASRNGELCLYLLSFVAHYFRCFLSPAGGKFNASRNGEFWVHVSSIVAHYLC